MDFDFNLILVPVTLILGMIWLADKLIFKQRKQKGKGNENFAIAWAYDFFPVLAVVLVVRSFIIEPFNIPSSSMVPTLYTGDFIAVNKYAYGLRLPLTYNKIMATGSPEHGDVAVFRYPKHPSIYYIKRVIGLPGDTVSYDDGVLSINGTPVPTQPVNYTPPTELTDQLYTAGQQIGDSILSPEQAAELGKAEEAHTKYKAEQFGQHDYQVRYLDGVNSSQYGEFLQQMSPQVLASGGKNWQIDVPQGHYFVMGDNRDRSEDGRFWGFVPDANLAGKAVYVWMHKKPGLNVPTFARNGNID